MKDSLTKKQIAKIVGIMLLAVLVIGVSVFGTFTTLYNASSSETTMSVENIPERIINIENDIASPQISLSSSEAFSTSDTGNSILKTITATVLPEDAPDKSVDWNISWITPIYDDAVVTDYVTVTPDSDGSTTATVTCYKGFEGASIRVTATTRVGGFTASCVVTYEGKPTEMVLESSGTEYEMVSLFNLSAGTTTSFNINLDNKLNAVGSKFGNFEIVSITGVGRFVAEKQYIVNGSVSSTEDVTLDLGSPTFTYQDDSNTITKTISMSDFLTASISGSVLTVNCIKNEKAFVFPSGKYPRTGYYFKYKSAYTDPRGGGVADNCYWIICIKDSVSDLDRTFWIDITSSVDSVALSESVLSF